MRMRSLEKINVYSVRILPVGVGCDQASLYAILRISTTVPLDSIIRGIFTFSESTLGWQPDWTSMISILMCIILSNSNI
jgi:hypothetical protein